MKLSSRVLGVLAMATLMTVPATAQDDPAARVTDEWQTGTGDLRYQLGLCSDGSLCGTMSYSRDPDPRLQRNVGKSVMDGAKRIGPQQWKGSMVFEGHRLSGVITLAGDVLKVDGCAYLILCGEFNLYRVGTVD